MYIKHHKTQPNQKTKIEIRIICIKDLEMFTSKTQLTIQQHYFSILTKALLKR